MSNLENNDQEAAAVQKTPNRVTLESMCAKIAAEEYYNPPLCPELTVCFLRMTNGFVLIGKSAPADAKNFNPELGRKFSREDAIRQIWPLEGYALRDRLMTESPS